MKSRTPLFVLVALTVCMTLGCEPKSSVRSRLRGFLEQGARGEAPAEWHPGQFRQMIERLDAASDEGYTYLIHEIYGDRLNVYWYGTDADADSITVVYQDGTSSVFAVDPAHLKRNVDAVELDSPQYALVTLADENLGKPIAEIRITKSQR